MGKRYATKRRLGAAKRRGTKRRATKRRATKRRGTKRRATRPRKSFRRKIIRGGSGEITKVSDLIEGESYIKITNNATITNSDTKRDYNIGLLQNLLKAGNYIVATGCDDDQCRTPNFKVITDTKNIESAFNEMEGDGTYAYTDFNSYTIENINFNDAKRCVSNSSCAHRGSKVYNDDDTIQFRQETYL